MCSYISSEHSANLELDSTSPSLKPVEEDTLTSESGLLEMKSNINNQEETTKGDPSDSVDEYSKISIVLRLSFLISLALHGEDSLSKHPVSAHEEATTRYNSILDMVLKVKQSPTNSKPKLSSTDSDHSLFSCKISLPPYFALIICALLQALCNLKVLKEDLVHNRQPFSDNQVPCVLRDFFSAFVSEQIEDEGFYSNLLSGLLASLEEVHSMVCAEDKF